MKYLTYRLWQSLQKPGSRAQHKWAQRAASYARVFDDISDKFDRATAAFFRSTGFHDGRVIGIKDAGARALSLYIEKAEVVYEAQFRAVNRINLEFRRQPRSEPQALLEWGYEEFSIVRKNLLQVDVIFSSGATLRVQFKRLVVKKIPRSALYAQ